MSWMRTHLGTVVAASALAVGAAAQASIVQYDAGVSPGLATSPTTQGWTELGVNSANGSTASAVNNDLATGNNAWNITDGSTSDRPRYEAALGAAEIADMAANGWVLTVVARGIGTSGNISWGVTDDSAFGGTGVARRWGTGFNIDGSGNLFIQWYGGSQVQATLDGSGAVAYHEVKLVGAAGSTNASLYVDGILVGTNSGQASSGTPNKIEFGGVSSGGTGSQVNWHYIDLSVAPEPASLGLLGLGGLMMARRRRPSAA